jgi:hypothetical protein
MKKINISLIIIKFILFTKNTNHFNNKMIFELHLSTIIDIFQLIKDTNFIFKISLFLSMFIKDHH